MYKSAQSGVAQLLVLLLLVAGIFAGVQLIGKSQELREKAQDSCPSDPQNYDNQYLLDNCDLGQLAQLSNERLITFSSDIIIQLPNSRLGQFSNDDLVKIGDATGDLPGFLNRFSNDRLLGPQLPNYILNRLPDSRIANFPCNIQQQLGRGGRGCPTPTPIGRVPTPTPFIAPTFVPTPSPTPAGPIPTRSPWPGAPVQTLSPTISPFSAPTISPSTPSSIGATSSDGDINILDYLRLFWMNIVSIFK